MKRRRKSADPSNYLGTYHTPRGVGIPELQKNLALATQLHHTIDDAERARQLQQIVGRHPSKRQAADVNDFGHHAGLALLRRLGGLLELLELLELSRRVSQVDQARVLQLELGRSATSGGLILVTLPDDSPHWALQQRPHLRTPTLARVAIVRVPCKRGAS